MQNIILSVEPGLEGIRIDKFLSENLPEYSRSFLQKNINDNNVTINNIPAKSSTKVKAGDEISITVPDSQIPDIEPEDIPLDILYEDNDVIVINKPKDMVVHPGAGNYSGTVVNALLYYCKDSLSGINGVLRPGIVHRIDKDTTGSLIICKNDNAHKCIAEQLAAHSLKRSYLALCYGVFAEKKGTINAPIGRDPKDRLKMAINYSGKRAVTHYSVLEQYEKFALVECRLETGRTHQIRVHMTSIGHPLLGDDTYKTGFSTKIKLKGQCLHAYELGFVHPVTKEEILVKAPIPDYFEQIIGNHNL